MTAWKGAAPSRDEQHRLKRDAVLKAAARAFSQQGFHATSLSEIARELNVTKTALYYYVKSKNEILLECLKQSTAVGDAALKYGQSHGGSGREKVILCLRRYVTEMTKDMGGLALFAELKSLPPRERKIIIAERDKFDRAMREMVAEGAADGSIVECDPKLTVFAMMGAVNWLPRWFSPEGDRSPEEIADAFVALFERGLKPR